MDPSLVFKFWSQRKPELPDWDPELTEISGYSGILSGNSGFTRILRVFLRIVWTWSGISCVLGLVTVPKRYYFVFHSFSLSPRALPLSLALNSKSFPPNPFPRPKKLKSTWGIIFSRYSTLGWFHFRVFLAMEASSRYLS